MAAATVAAAFARFAPPAAIVVATAARLADRHRLLLLHLGLQLRLHHLLRHLVRARPLGALARPAFTLRVVALLLLALHQFLLLPPLLHLLADLHLLGLLRLLLARLVLLQLLLARELVALAPLLLLLLVACRAIGVVVGTLLLLLRALLPAHAAVAVPALAVLRTPGGLHRRQRRLR